MAFNSNASTNETLYNLTAPVPTATGTTGQVLGTYTLPAGTMKRAGQGLRIRAFGHTAANGNTKTVALSIGGQAVHAAASAAANNKDWEISVQLTRGAKGLQEAVGTGNFNATALAPQVSDLTLDETAAQVIALTATDGTSSAADITLSGFVIEGLSD